MKYLIQFYYVKSDHILAMPEHDHDEIVESDSKSKLQKYIESKKDQWGHSFKKEKSFGYDYISNAGAVKVKKYKEPNIRKL